MNTGKNTVPKERLNNIPLSTVLPQNESVWNKENRFTGWTDDDLKLVNDYFLGDPEEIKKLMEAVANQGKKK